MPEFYVPAVIGRATLIVGILLSLEPLARLRRGALRTRRFWVGVMLALAGLLYALLPFLASSRRLPVTVVLGCLVAAFLIHRVALAFREPFASNRLVRELLILRAVLPAFFCASLFLWAWSPTANSAPYVMLGGIVLYLAVARPRVKHLVASIRGADGSAQKRRGG